MAMAPLYCSMDADAPKSVSEYTEGIWYDMHNGDFTKIRWNNRERLVELVNPENGDVYWDMPLDEWEASESADFYRVRQEAIDDPVAVVNRAIRMVARNDMNELASIPLAEAIAIRYAREQVTVAES